MNQGEIEKIADRLFTGLQRELGLTDAIAESSRRGQPMLVRDLDGNPSYWLVPVASGDRLVGLLRLGLEGELMAYGRFGQMLKLSDFPPLSYLSVETASEEIRKIFGVIYEDIRIPQLVHDGPTERIAWLSRGNSVEGVQTLLFWTFGTSYSRPEGEEPDHGLL